MIVGQNQRRNGTCIGPRTAVQAPLQAKSAKRAWWCPVQRIANKERQLMMTAASGQVRHTAIGDPSEAPQHVLPWGRFVGYSPPAERQLAGRVHAHACYIAYMLKVKGGHWRRHSMPCQSESPDGARL